MEQLLLEQIGQACDKLFAMQPNRIALERPDAQFGDYAVNVAMQLAKPLGRPPRDIAQELVSELESLEEVESVGVAGPGFINITLQDSLVWQQAQTEPAKIMEGLKVLAEYSDPNPFKPLHAGHLYTTLVGDAMARLVEAAGADTVRLNFGGDVGLHVGRTMWAILQSVGGEDVSAVEAIPVDERAAWMGARYVEGTRAYDNDEQAKAEIIALNKRVYVLHTDNDTTSGFAQIYWLLRANSYDFFKQLYQSLQAIEFDRFIPESEVTPLGLETVRKQLADGVFKESDGAVVFDGEAHGLHTRVFINSEGLPTYEAKDVGLSLTKWKDYGFDESIIITAAEQAQYMQVVIKAIEQFAPDPAKKTRHLTHGTVKLAGGVKMSSRKGNILMADDILQAARDAGTASGQASTNEIMLGAVKYAFLKNRVGSDVVYDPQESISMEGNSGPYLQYAHARARSILRKAGDVQAQVDEKATFDTQERLLARKLSEYAETIQLATVELAPHHICSYLYELAQVFNRFYEQSKVIGDDRQNIRLALVSQYAKTLHDGLSLLGIHSPEQM